MTDVTPDYNEMRTFVDGVLRCAADLDQYANLNHMNAMYPEALERACVGVAEYGSTVTLASLQLLGRYQMHTRAIDRLGDTTGLIEPEDLHLLWQEQIAAAIGRWEHGQHEPPDPTFTAIAREQLDETYGADLLELHFGL